MDRRKSNFSLLYDDAEPANGFYNGTTTDSDVWTLLLNRVNLAVLFFAFGVWLAVEAVLTL